MAAVAFHAFSAGPRDFFFGYACQNSSNPGDAVRDAQAFEERSSVFSSLFCSVLAFVCVRSRSFAFACVWLRSSRHFLARSAAPSSRFGWRCSHFRIRPSWIIPLSSNACIRAHAAPSGMSRLRSAVSQSYPSMLPRSTQEEARQRSCVHTARASDARTPGTDAAARLAIMRNLGSSPISSYALNQCPRCSMVTPRTRRRYAQPTGRTG